MFAGLAIFFILTWKTREFDLNFASQKFYFLLNQLVFLCFGNENTILKEANTVTTSLSAPEVKKFVLSGCYEVT